MNESSFLGQGWSFPPVFDATTHTLKLTAGEPNINQSIDLLLKTPRGSRTLLPEFGCNLFSYLFRRIDATAQEEIIQSVKTTLLNDEPRITVIDVDVGLSDEGAMVSITVVYQILQTNSRHNHVIPFAQLEGTNLQLGV